MKRSIFSSATVMLLLQTILFAQAGRQAETAKVESFSPSGTVKRVRQVQARFSESMVPFGDLRDVAQPFEVNCPEKGQARWVDDRNWVYDFDSDLPAGVNCEFTLRKGLQTLAKKNMAGQNAWSFSTGGPAITRSNPYAGNSIDEEQVFILHLDADATEDSVLKNVYFTVDGISSRIGARIVSGSERDAIIKSEYRWWDTPPSNLLLLQAKQKFPSNTNISLVWGRGIATLSGVETTQDQTFSYKTRQVFKASFTCERENKDAKCVPVSPMEVEFTAPISNRAAKQARLKGLDGKTWSPANSGLEDDDSTTQSLAFNGPFPPLSDFTIELPAGLKDDAGRALANAREFPLTVHTDAYPPLAKFAADFGILELKDSPALPVTLRNVEASVKARMLEVNTPNSDDNTRQAAKGQVSGAIQGKSYRVPNGSVDEMLFWIRQIRARSWDWDNRDKSVFNSGTWVSYDKNLFDSEAGKRAKSFSIPKPQGSRAFEVVGIPFEKPGFYVVEIESAILGSALLGSSKPMYVPAAALVTNLSVHFKWGNESSLVWVTALDNAAPVPNASIQVRDCEGTLHWQGETNKDGVAHMKDFSAAIDLPYCSDRGLNSGLVISAQKGDDLSFVLSSWNDGIEPWRYQLPTEWDPEPTKIHTVFDRTLLRPGETVHMKYILRKRVLAGFASVPTKEIKEKVWIEHSGSEQKYELPLQWNAGGSAESAWDIPKDAKLGQYSVYFRYSDGKKADSEYARIYAGNFRVEEYRVPLMKAFLRSPSDNLVAPKTVPVDMTVTYLAGGGAGELPVKFRYLVEPRYAPGPDAYEGFSFSGGKIKEGLTRDTSENEDGDKKTEVKSKELALDRLGSARAVIDELPQINTPMSILAEMDFKDPNGETQTASTRIPLWPSSLRIGIKPDGWALSKESLKFQVVALDLSGKPVAGTSVKVNLFERKTYSHRKRLVGGFYAYEHSTETRRVQEICSGKTDSRGLLLCDGPVSVSGSIILEAVARDGEGRETAANTQVWVAGDKDWWFTASDNDRMDVLPENKRYEPGDTARLQVRMPFRNATALITVEREGVGETFVREISGKEPVIELPVKASWAPNVFISVLAVRGRSNEIQPTATVDLGRPAFRLGIAEIQVGWKSHELKVKVSPEREVYKVREKARVKIAVTTADGTPLPEGSEVALAAVDEGLLELMPNESWNLLNAMMGRRSYGVKSYTAQMQVVGKRHFGLKALPQGGGGGNTSTRELFDTLLIWKGRVRLNAGGEAEAEIPLNDSLTSFRIVAVATGGIDRFGSGSASIRASQDLLLFSGVPPLARQGDRFAATFTARNAAERSMKVKLSLKVEPAASSPAPQEITLESGESREIHFDLTAPKNAESLKYTLDAVVDGVTADKLAVTQKVIPALPVRIIQATLTQIEENFSIPVEMPADAVRGAGELRVAFQARLSDGLDGVASYMRAYPYNCLEQQTSRAISLRDAERWKTIMANLPAYLDGDGLAKYFTSMRYGDDALTSYIISVANEAGWQIPESPKEKMLSGLRNFVEGHITRGSSLQTSDTVMRKLAAIEALAREKQANPALLSSITIAPNLWPTSAVIDWLNILTLMTDYKDRAARRAEAQQILRARLNLQGTTMGFSTERSDALWWLMVSVDQNAVRLLSSVVNLPEWKQDIPRLVRGALGRQHAGHWDTTTANAWGILAMEKFSKAFENIPVTGKSNATLAEQTKSVDWKTSPKGKVVSFPWPDKQNTIDLEMNGTGKPWATIQSLAAIPLKEPLSSGFKITRTVIPIEQKVKGTWSAGDIARVRIEIESQTDMTWVVVNDPIPTGSAILGTGLGRDSALSARGEERKGWAWPAFEERSFEAYRAYYEYVPKGNWSTEYTLRLNNAGRFQLPPTRVEALYAPEMFGEFPIPSMEVK